ncbi:MAG: NUDIX hydrolase [Desulfobacterales bacterium]|nr:NUDIX hydrolase [Desulfobacterales bacterium]
MNFCSNCAAPVTLEIPEGDDRLRHVCRSCGMIHYQNPKMVVGCIPMWRDRLLLCRRSIEPRRGKWTLPAGYLENNETAAQGAARETLEEAGARVKDLTLYGVYNLPFVDQVYLIFRADMVDDDFEAGAESLDVRLFDPDQIPWDELAFTVIRETLDRWVADRRTGEYTFHVGDIQGARTHHPDPPPPPGASPAPPTE